MFVEDIRRDFYNVIVGKRIAVFVSFDVDALCACKILQYLLQCDHIIYSLIPVSGIQELESAFHEHTEQIKHFVFINCGANINLVDLLQPDDDDVFFVADSHRPIDVFNIYNGQQVRLLMKLEDDCDVPALEDIYREEDVEDPDEDLKPKSDSEDNDDEESERAAKRKRFDQSSAIERRIELKNWEKQRDKLLFEYNQFSYYGQSTAAQFFDIAWKMSKDSNDLLWWAAIGLTDGLINHKIEQSQYVLQAGVLQGHVSRLNHRSEDENNSSVQRMRLSFDTDLQLALYRHWSLYQSLKNTSYTACQFRLWTLRGQKKLFEFLADLGLPLSQCKQQFSAMDLLLRNNVKAWIEEKAGKYGLDQLLNGSFLAQFGYKNRFCAADVVYAATALLENADASRTATENFLDALACLSRSNLDALKVGMELAKKQLTDNFNQIQTFLDLNQVISAGLFLYAVVSENSGSRYFMQPVGLLNLAHCLLQAHVVKSRNRKSQSLPLILVAPCKSEKEEDEEEEAGGGGTSLVVGIPPMSEDSLKSFFGQAFLQAGSTVQARTIHNFFDPSIIQINTMDNGIFFDSLVMALK